MRARFPGDAEIVINGETHVLRLTLGALAEIEEAFGGDYAALVERLKAPRVRDLLLILHALVRGGGSELTLELLQSSDVDFAAAAAAIGKAFRALDPNALEAPGKRRGATRKTPVKRKAAKRKAMKRKPAKRRAIASGRSPNGSPRASSS